MRKYELMTIYPLEEDKYKAGLENVKSVLSQFGAEIHSEEPYGTLLPLVIFAAQKIFGVEKSLCLTLRNGKLIASNVVDFIISLTQLIV